MFWLDYRDPFDSMERFRDDMNRLLSGYGRAGAVFPPVNMWTGEDEAVIAAEVPGVAPEDMDLTVQGNELTISGERKAHEPREGAQLHRRERLSGSFSRRIHLPYEVEREKVSAEYRDGILKITLPRAEATRPRRIAITGEE
ncbi:Hsp20/alpha crystallin family protein [Kiritimatiella glycovorans]|uniref:Heat shock protein Hsp20 n=1 Tax=Kiritimatiella glycovorans TaxID=1307763 RepID=A0A0G3ED83_9BACT|nr:Hsp20/alpha crystallin family protein [Kiritimatiella glycovorans]AKJ63312.1 heat shock protein Hsp20 [Kiritimatiella glycovorans]